jgi:hypothetical protein
MKFIIIIIFLILIVFFATKANTEYKREHFKQGCTTACGMFTTDDGCLNCVNCGICTIKYKDRISRQCLNGDKNGAYFNNNCKGSNWNYGDKDDKDDNNYLAELIYQRNVRQEQIKQDEEQDEEKDEEQDEEQDEEKQETDPISDYDRILLSMGQRVDVSKKLVTYNRSQKSSFGNFINPDGKVDIPDYDRYAQEKNSYNDQNEQSAQTFGQNDYTQGPSREKLNNGYDYEQIQTINKNYESTLFTLEDLTKNIKL